MLVKIEREGPVQECNEVSIFSDSFCSCYILHYIPFDLHEFVSS